MKIVIIVFIIIASIFSIGTLSYVIADYVYYKVKGEEKSQEEPEPIPVPVPEPEPEPEPRPEPPVIPIVEEVTAEEVDELISDDVALSTVLVEEETGPAGYKTFINLGVINSVFSAGDVVTLSALKEKKLVPAKTRRIKVLADGVLSKPLTVKANSYSVQAIKMIEVTGGTVVIRKVVQ